MFQRRQAVIKQAVSPKIWWIFRFWISPKHVQLTAMYQRTFRTIFREIPKIHSRGFFPNHKYCSAAQNLLIRPELDIEYLVDPANRNEIEDNIKKRRGVSNLNQIIELYNQLKGETDSSAKEKLYKSLLEEASKIPNATHPDVKLHPNKPKRIKSTKMVDINFRPKRFNKLAKDLALYRDEELSTLTGRRSYFFGGDLADLEHALVKYTLFKLLRRNFRLISVPDILPAEFIEGCGMKTQGTRTQVFKLEDSHWPNKYLSGTSEIGLASLNVNTVKDVNDLPICLASVSRCHRAELSTVKEEHGLFRVHHFTKVEMFGISHPDKSEELFQTFVDIQEEIFSSLGLDFSILEMPMDDLGASAYRKFDIEAWFPGREIHGEISSCSNCTDYQARRLNIKFRDKDGIRHVHTVNGTACAVPRMVMALFETHQLENGNISIPEPLRIYLDGKEEIWKQAFTSEDTETVESRQA